MPRRTPSDARLRRLRIDFQATDRFTLPAWEGVAVSTALESALTDNSRGRDDAENDRTPGGYHVSGLRGRFGTVPDPSAKAVVPGRTYTLAVGAVGRAGGSVLDSLVDEVLLGRGALSLPGGTLEVTAFEIGSTTQQALLERAASVFDPTVRMTFRTPTCLEEGDGGRTLFPHRVTVFSTLLGQWNRTAPGEIVHEANRETLAGAIGEHPDPQRYDVHALSFGQEGDGGEESPADFQHGFTGVCEYTFSGASEAVQNALTATALYGEYSGVGSAVARGCGDVSVELFER